MAEPDDLEKLLAEVRKTISDNRQFLEKLVDEADVEDTEEETEDIYNSKEREEMLDDDEITAAEEGFMRGREGEEPSKKETRKNAVSHDDQISVELAKALRNIIGRSCVSFLDFNLEQTSKPLISGSLISSKTKSGNDSLIESNASSPVSDVRI